MKRAAVFIAILFLFVFEAGAAQPILLPRVQRSQMKASGPVIPDFAAESPPLVVLSADPQPPWLGEALRAGVRGVLPREASTAEIAAAIEAAAAGLVVLHPEAVDAATTRRTTEIEC